ncbi:MAG: HAD family hydrolase [Clostridia bacterium]|nr:HAD family hydrolase [Clostridia bacterium]
MDLKHNWSPECIVFDLDDTLLRDDRTISKRTLSALRACHDRGIRILPASGRAMESMIDYVREIGVASHFIACNGGEIWEVPDTIVQRLLIPERYVHEIALDLCRRRLYAHTYDGNSFYYNAFDGGNGYARDYAVSSKLTGHLVDDFPSFASSHPTGKLMCISDPQTITDLRGIYQEKYAGILSVTTSKPFFMEINPLHATKGEALHDCSELMHFDLKRTWAFGDSFNDLSMLLAAGRSFAVKNAQESVLHATTDICPSNEEDGVACVLEQLLLS